MGNLNNDLKDLKELFGLKTISERELLHRIGYKLQNWKNKGIAFVSSPDHELFNLNGIDFYGKNSILEEGMSPRKKWE